MIVTLTANPSIDRAVTLGSALEVGEVQRAAGSREDAGGKGVNVARVIDAAGVEVLAVVPVGATDPYRSLLAETGVPHRAVAIAGRVRANLTIADPAGVTTKINLAGAALSHGDVAALVAEVVHAAEGAAWLVLAGSLPPGAPVTFYRDLARAVRERWGAAAPRIAVDASGEALRHVLEAGAADLVKPNDEELAEALGEDASADADRVAEAVRRARAIVPARVPAALVTLGGDGALLVTADAVLRARAPRIRVVSTVGAGDSSLAGYLLADVAGADPAARLARSVAYGAAAASLPGTQAPTARDLPAAAIEVVPHPDSH